ncbi:RNA polymerase sigma factor [Lachnospiraceae bacterium 62-35]
MDGTEAEMIRSMQKGDEEAFAYLFSKYQAAAFRTAYLISGNTADSEDIVQETFVKCFISRKELKEPRAFQGWLFRILTRTAWRHVKKRSKEQPAEEIWGGESECRGDSLLEEIVEGESREMLYKAIRGLEIKQRTAVILYYFNEFSTREIAAAMGCMEGTVKSRLYTARKNLRERLGEPEQEEQYERRIV